MNKKLIILSCAAAMAVSCFTAPVYAGINLSEVNSNNYLEYEKSVKDAYGYNKRECERAYLPHEEYYYSDYYDHWNVDKVYDANEIDKVFKVDKAKKIKKNPAKKVRKAVKKVKRQKSKKKFRKK